MFNWIEPSGPNKVRLPYPEPPAEGNTPSLATFDFAEEIEAITPAIPAAIAMAPIPKVAADADDIFG